MPPTRHDRHAVQTFATLSECRIGHAGCQDGETGRVREGRSGGRCRAFLEGSGGGRGRGRVSPGRGRFDPVRGGGATGAAARRAAGICGASPTPDRPRRERLPATVAGRIARLGTGRRNVRGIPRSDRLVPHGPDRDRSTRRALHQLAGLLGAALWRIAVCGRCRSAHSSGVGTRIGVRGSSRRFAPPHDQRS